ncbi:cytochrome oxidase assembly protein [Actinotalea ferrariae CF5-4]|uniref:Cytochrome oxidase assembly protein n=1 Tax=Actinotalea ferrariae CF5-4 TaxID=948458 RepID=A0A021VSN7_9CELL|nr:COX15/CtaA family protein [Actinotalea ferrariae]EYR62077.1 cytochrome oxidase assembly protein [Actinotalea ferrariae CF5-4]
MSTTARTDGPVPTSARASRLAPSPRWARRILWANLVAQVAIVVTGGAVRLTGSGLGCSTWPQCEPGQFAPQFHEATSWHPYIEFGNRTLTGVLGILALLTAWTIVRRRDRSRSFRLLGLVPLLGTLVQAVVGGLTVLLELHPGWVGTHFVLSMLLIVASRALLVRHAEGDGPPRPLVDARTRQVSRLLVPLSAVVVVLGVITTGAGPHSGDADIPYRLALDPAAVSRVHAVSVWAYVAGVVALVVLTRRVVAGRVRTTALRLLAVTLAQGLIGYVQYFTGLPVVLVGLHMLGAGLLVAVQTNQFLSLRERDEASATSAAPAAPVTAAA